MSKKIFTASTQIILLIVTIISFFLVAIIQYLRKKKQTSNTSTVQTPPTPILTSYGGGGGVTSPTYYSFGFNDAYGVSNTKYLNSTEAYDKNLSDSGITNRQITIYAESITNGKKAFTTNSATTTIPSGFYYYPAENLVIQVASDGTMTIIFDDVKPTDLTAINLKISHN